MIYGKQLSQLDVERLIELGVASNCMNQSFSPLHRSGHIQARERQNGYGTGRTSTNIRMSKAISRVIDDMFGDLPGYDGGYSGRFAWYEAPIPIHCDGINILGSRTQPANTTVFVPLLVKPRDGQNFPATTWTIYFDQVDPYYPTPPAKDEAENFYVLHGRDGWSDTHDYSDLIGYTGKPFDPEIHQRWLSQHPIERLHGFSFKEAVEWEIGRLQFFESGRIHCSAHITHCAVKYCFLFKMNTSLFDNASYGKS